MKKVLVGLAVTLFMPPLVAQMPGGEWKMLGDHQGTAWNDGYGGALAVLPDLNGDGLPEIANGSYAYKNAQGQIVGRLQVLSGASGNILWEYTPTVPAAHNGTILTAGIIESVPDLDGDGVADILIGQRNFNGNEGRVEVLSGVDGAFIRHHSGSIGPVHGFGEGLGNSILGVEDISGDGLGDYLLGSPSAENSAGERSAGYLSCYSGLDGQLLWRIVGYAESVNYGATLAQASDFNGDGLPDIYMSTGEEYLGVNDLGMVHVVSATQGQILASYPPISLVNGEAYGGSLAVLPDLDGDSIEELLVGSKGFGSGGTFQAGSVELRMSGSPSSFHWRAEGDVVTGFFGSSIEVLSDLDQDGYPDIAVVQELPLNQDEPRVHILSGMTGRTLWELQGQDQYSGFGWAVGSMDRDGDGFSELVIAEPHWGIGYLGRLLVLSLEPFLVNDGTLTQSASTSGELRFQLDFPSTEAGLPFAVLASSSGPGSFSYGGVGIPLTMDATLQQVYRNPPPSFRGTLDGDGDHLVVTRLPAGSLSSFVGSTLHFAAVTLVGGQPSLSSVAVPIEVLP